MPNRGFASRLRADMLEAALAPCGGSATETRLLSALKTAGAARFPRLFALASVPADWRAAANPASELQFLPLVVRPGDMACDVGANRGLFTYWLLRLGARVAAFEPNPAMMRVLGRRFARARHEGRLTLGGHAVSDIDGKGVLHIPHDHAALATLDGRLDGSEAVDAIDVPRHRLDDCVRGPVDFIKIDVEGHEAAVLEGARRILAASHPTVLLEAEERHCPGALARVRGILEPLGYEGYFAQADGLHPVTAFDAGRMQDIGALNEEGTRVREAYGYVNNFLFVARPEVRERLLNWRPSRALLRA